jgi:hypothetical protein
MGPTHAPPSPEEPGALSETRIAELESFVETATRLRGSLDLEDKREYAMAAGLLAASVPVLLAEVRRLRTELEREREECALEAEKAAKFSLRWQGARLELARVRTKLKARLARVLRAAFHPRRIRDDEGDWHDAGYSKSGVWSSKRKE